MFEYDTEKFSNEVQTNVRTLMEFQRDFDTIEKNFTEIEEMNRKSRQMKELVKGIMKKYESSLPSHKLPKKQVK